MPPLSWVPFFLSAESTPPYANVFQWGLRSILMPFRENQRYCEREGGMYQLEHLEKGWRGCKMRMSLRIRRMDRRVKYARS